MDVNPQKVLINCYLCDPLVQQQQPGAKLCYYTHSTTDECNLQ